MLGSAQQDENASTPLYGTSDFAGGLSSHKRPSTAVPFTDQTNH